MQIKIVDQYFLRLESTNNLFNFINNVDKLKLIIIIFVASVCASVFVRIPYYNELHVFSLGRHDEWVIINTALRAIIQHRKDS